MFDIQSFLKFWIYNPESPLIFTSKDFLLLFTCFLIVYNFLRKNFNLRVLYVTCFSLYFYYLTGGLYFFLLLLMSFTDHSLGFFIYNVKQEKLRKLLLTLSLVIDLGILGYFKYTNFIGEMIADFMGKPYEMKNIFLPVGISFFTFQSLSYVIDIYRRQLVPTPRWIDYLFYLSFFPQLVAGPIVRAKDFLPQIARCPKSTFQMANYGLLLILMGFVKKVFISDYISINFVDRVFDTPLQYSGFENLIGVYGYALQIYCDFSGYSDIAIGIAFLLGFRFSENFHFPYKAATITEFWKRWHISLSSWLQDYLYISLGGNRKGQFRTYVNLFLTMLLGGLWHGANIRFVLWGAFHGLALCIHKICLRMFPSWKRTGKGMTRVHYFFSTLLTFHFVCFCWIIFRVEDMESFRCILSQIVNDFEADHINEMIQSHWVIYLIILLGYLFQFIPETIINQCKVLFIKTPVILKAFITIFIFWLTMQIQSEDVQPFIYFQF